MRVVVMFVTQTKLARTEAGAVALGIALAMGVLLALGSGQGVLLADTGYDLDYDYPQQGDDWYGSGLPDNRRDYPGTSLPFLDGADFGVGYESSLDLLEFGPPLVRTNLQRLEYRFRFDAASECVDSAECSDGLFCNGAEVCGFDSFCEPGPPPNCDDGDSCTSDSCSESQDQCVNDPVPAPGAVSGLTLALSNPDPDIATLSWDPVSDADAYNVYRGEDPQLSDLGCFHDNIPDTSVDDDGALPPSGLFVHLVSARACGESGLGEDSDGNDRPNDAPCP